MNLGQTTLVLLALVLLSTILIGIYNNMMTQMEFAARNIYQTQGLKIADFVFQEYESRLLGNIISFDDLTLSPAGRDIEIDSVEGATYFVNVTSQFTDRQGVASPLPNTNFQRLDVRIRVNTGQADIFIGTADSPLSKVFARVHDDF